MAHNFESGFFSGGVPAWHGLGTVLEGHPKTSAEAIKAAELDWRVVKVPMFIDWQGQKLDVPEKYAMTRDKDGTVLGVVGSRYTPLQNVEAFEFFDDIVTKGIAKFETAGSLGEGKKVWVLAKLAGDIGLGNNDVIEKYVLLSNTHDGTGKVIAKVTPVRVVCQNTLNYALHQHSYDKEGILVDEVAIRHTKTVVDKVKEAARVLQTVQKAYDKLAEIWAAMTKVQMPVVAVQEYLKAVVPDNPDSKNPYRTQRIRTEMFQLMEDTNLGGQMFPGTLWNAYNAVTAYSDHMQSKREDSSPDKHLNSVWFGDRADLKSTAFEVALDTLQKAA